MVVGQKKNFHILNQVKNHFIFMSDIKTAFREIVINALKELIKSANKECPINEEKIVAQPPTKPELGDLGIPMFPFSKPLGMPPNKIAEEVLKIILAQPHPNIGEFLTAGAFVNLRINKADAMGSILGRIIAQGDEYGSFNDNNKKPLEGNRVMIEFSSPNTNKPLHLGHLRNDALGESVSRILKKAGADVYKVDLINNRGVHICKSMLAYQLFHEAKNETPESLHIKGDHFVGQCYVEFEKERQVHPEVEKQAEDMLILWEQNDPAIHALWQKMNDWTLNGIKTTYERTGITFDRIYLESETYLKGKDEILKGLDKGIFYKAEDGSVRIDITPIVGKNEKNHEKVLLRKDGTSVYITQDIGTAISRHEDWPFNQLVYVVATEQNHHFKVLFYILKQLGFDWAQKLYHLSYGMVNLPTGRMKSREGTVVDADDLLDNLHAEALALIKQKKSDEALDNPDDVAEKVALAALHFYLLQVSPNKNMLFNPEESLNFNGDTGPFIQYTVARINSVLTKAADKGIASSNEHLALLAKPEEWALVKNLGAFPETVQKSAETFDPSIIAIYALRTCQLYNKFYQECPILDQNQPELSSARLYLTEAARIAIKNAMDLSLIPYLEKM